MNFGSWMGMKAGPGNAQNTDKTDTNSTTTTNTNENKTEDKDKLSPEQEKVFNEVWSQGTEQTTDDKNKTTTPDNQQRTQVDQTPPDQRLAAHLKEVGLEPIVLNEQEVEAYKSGNLDINALLARQHAQAVNAYTKSMSNMSTVIDAKVAKAIETSGQNTRQTLEGIELRDLLEENIPYIKGNALMGPVAETAFKSYLGKTKGDRALSIKLTKRFLQETANQVLENDPEMQVDPQTSGNSFGRKSPNKGEEDWLKLLRQR